MLGTRRTRLYYTVLYCNSTVLSQVYTVHYVESSTTKRSQVSRTELEECKSPIPRGVDILFCHRSCRSIPVNHSYSTVLYCTMLGYSIILKYPVSPSCSRDKSANALGKFSNCRKLILPLNPSVVNCTNRGMGEQT